MKHIDKLAKQGRLYLDRTQYLHSVDGIIVGLATPLNKIDFSPYDEKVTKNAISATLNHLESMGIETIHQLVALIPDKKIKHIGEQGIRIIRLVTDYAVNHLNLDVDTIAPSVRQLMRQNDFGNRL